MQSTPTAVIGIVLLAVISFTSGWFVGRTTASDINQEARLARLEAGAQAPAARPPVAAPPPAAAAAAPVEVKQVDVGKAFFKGPENAKVTIVEFSDFECPFCSRVNPALEKLLETYPDDVRVAFKHFPLPFHQKAVDAHKASIAAGEQGKFWEMHDWIFANRSKLDPPSLRAQAEALGLDMAKYDAALAKAGAQVDADKSQGQSLGVRGTPSFFINGKLLTGAQPFETFEQRVKEELAKG